MSIEQSEMSAPYESEYLNTHIEEFDIGTVMSAKTLASEPTGVDYSISETKIGAYSEGIKRSLISQVLGYLDFLVENLNKPQVA